MYAHMHGLESERFTENAMDKITEINRTSDKF